MITKKYNIIDIKMNIFYINYIYDDYKEIQYKWTS